MKDIRIRQGATFERTFTDTDLSATDLTITISNEAGVVDTVTSNYTTVDGKAVATVRLDADYTVGEYEYMFTITYADGFVVKLPELADCTEGCELPKFIVCEANDEMGS